ncbi:MAG: carboxynorspermidine decarboxylase [Muribaculaceae bacterium]
MIYYPTPYYIVYEDKLRKNLNLITDVMARSGAKIIMAFKANALWRTFDIFREYGICSTASSLNEMLLANNELHCKAHAYCPVYTASTIDGFIMGCSHITFNSVEQFHRFSEKIKQHNAANPAEAVSCGLRVNPMCSVVETDIYNPCSAGSRFGVTAQQLGDEWPQGIDGMHFHALCESTSYDLQKVLTAIEEQFGKFLPQLKWINMGGGHLMTRQGYDVEHLIELITSFKTRYPNLEVILEPGSAFCWQTGDLEASVVDIVSNSGIQTAIVDVSFACHMPDCLEMPYQPAIEQSLEQVDNSKPTYRIGGNSCLSGDVIGDWSFNEPLKVGDRLTFKDMNHYTTVKTNMFNGIQHPAILLMHSNSQVEVLREYTYEDYKNRMC